MKPLTSQRKGQLQNYYKIIATQITTVNTDKHTIKQEEDS
jgi:hypothetical protein